MEAKKLRGMKYIHILSPCPPGWRYEEKLTPNIGRLAVETKFYPLYEIRDGKEYIITHLPKNLPVEDYLLAQGRFKHLVEKDLEIIQKEVDTNWDELKRRESQR